MSTEETKPELLERPRSTELDKILGQSFPVLDEGFVRVVDYMGTDSSVLQAARVSYGTGIKTRTEDEALIRFMMRHGHTSPFEHCSIKFHIKVPMDCWRQWIRHRTAKVNEYSTRYSVAIDSTQATPSNQWRLQSKSNKQCSGDYFSEEIGKSLSFEEAQLHAMSRSVYEKRLQVGVAKEQARKDLPLSTYTETYWTMDLHNLLHFLRLRMDKHAQKEIRDYANVIGDIVKMWCPLSWQAFEEYQRNSMRLSKTEQYLITQKINNGDIQSDLVACGWITFAEDGLAKESTEYKEFKTKLESLGLK